MEDQLKTQVKNFIIAGLEEDVRDGDHTSLACISPHQISKAKLLVKDDCILAGIELAKMVFEYVDADAKVEILKEDGSHAKFGDIAFYLTCNTQALLKAERLVLNMMQRMSGIATMSDAFKKKIGQYDIQILDTRKTTPLIRFLEKWAVRIGGCTNYRDGLYDRFMIKDNHVEAAGGIRQAIERVHMYKMEKGLHLETTVEVRNFEEMREAMEVGGFERIMLDNFTPEQASKAVDIIGDQFEIEVSGGINLSNVLPYAQSGVDFASSGALTHSVISKDLSLKIIENIRQ